MYVSSWAGASSRLSSTRGSESEKNVSVKPGIMDTVELQHLLDKSRVLSTLNARVCPKDLLPDRKPDHVKAYIVNTHNSYQPGEHWVAIYFRENTAIFFDSYGLPPSEDYIQPFLDRHCRQWTMNRKRLQHGNSTLCGVYCLYALHCLALKINLHTNIFLRFRTGPNFWSQNDKYVEQWFKENYGPLYQEARTLPKP